ncbi:MAG: GntR family transcriptional regulator [Polynucleobacter sp.]|nr:GntR family transcriptional regulator [Polynucleobacter sp.]MDZ4055770.1 GntR family transcriptional regulator [Polynucleobacter sp.]
MKISEIAFNTFEPLWLRVYQPVRERILKGYLLPGAMLSENQLAEEFEVSRTPVREAVRLLINDGLVAVSPGKKMRVMLPSPKDIHEVYDIRSIIEREALRRLFDDKKLPAILARMERYCDDGDKALKRKDIDGLARANEQFHSCFMDALKNDRLLDQFRAMHQLITMYRLQTLQNDIWAETGNQDHRNLIEKIKTKKIQDAINLLGKHIHGAEETLVKRFKNTKEK